MLKTRPQLLEFILNMLSNPWFSSIMSWEGINGQFTIIRPEQAAQLWGDRNGRRNMTYQKFSRALRYYYHKKVLTKIRGQNYTYKFDFQQLEWHYGYRGRSSVTFHQPTCKQPIHDSFLCGLQLWCISSQSSHEEILSTVQYHSLNVQEENQTNRTFLNC